MNKGEKIIDRHTDRLGYIDTAKGLGIIFVLVQHHLLGVEPINNWLLSFHMPLFFIISGYLYAYKDNYKKPVSQVIISKLKGLLFPYLTLSCIVIVWHLFFFGVLFPDSKPENTTCEIVLLTISTYGYHAFWFITCLFYSSIIFAFLRKFHLHNIVCIILLVVLLGVLNYSNQIDGFLLRFVVRIGIGVINIYLGFLMYKIINKSTSMVRIILLFSCLTISLISLFGYFFWKEYMPYLNISICNFKNPLFGFLFAFLNSLFFILLSSMIDNKALRFLGKNSIIILAFHMDISIELAYFIVDKIPVNLGITVMSIIAIVIEFVFLCLMILCINNHFRFIYQFPSKKLQ